MRKRNGKRQRFVSHYQLTIYLSIVVSKITIPRILEINFGCTDIESLRETQNSLLERALEYTTQDTIQSKQEYTRTAGGLETEVKSNDLNDIISLQLWSTFYNNVPLQNVSYY